MNLVEGPTPVVGYLLRTIPILIEADGAGLACGLFEYLLELGDFRPKVLCATHFHEIFEYGLLLPRSELQFGHMEVQIDPKEDSDLPITYLYKSYSLLIILNAY